MLNTTNRANQAKNSSLFAKFLRKRGIVKNQEASNFDFIRINQGSLTSTTIDTGAVKMSFYSAKTGRKAFAYGATFAIAYQNLIRNFNQKYLVA